MWLTFQTDEQGQFTPLTVVLMAVLFCFGGVLVGNLLVLGGTYLAGIDFKAITQIHENYGEPQRWHLRIVLLINHLFTFVFPSIVLMYLMYKSNMSNYFGLDKPLERGWMGYFLIWFVLLMPLVQYLYIFNQSLPLPEWAKSAEDETNGAIKFILKDNSILELFANLLIMAIIPAIGEELFFRGIVQKELSKMLTPIWAIIVCGMIFSAFHIQFEGFLPRWLMGMALGWIFYIGKNILYPILIHFFNNAIQVLAMYLYERQSIEINIDEIKEIPLSIVLFSLGFVVILGYRMFRQKQLSSNQA